eukprot:497631_1
MFHRYLFTDPTYSKEPSVRRIIDWNDVMTFSQQIYIRTDRSLLYGAISLSHLVYVLYLLKALLHHPSVHYELGESLIPSIIAYVIAYHIYPSYRSDTNQ